MTQQSTEERQPVRSEQGSELRDGQRWQRLLDAYEVGLIDEEELVQRPEMRFREPQGKPQGPPGNAKQPNMKAAVVYDFTKPLRIEDVPKPTPGLGEIVVKIEASGICHSDIHAAHGDWPNKPKLPFTPGHEGVGIVESIGQG